MYLLSLYLLQHSVHPIPFLLQEGGRVEPPTRFLKRKLRDRISIYKRGCWERRVDLFQGGRWYFYIKNKLKYEIFTDKKKFINKSVFSANLNWEEKFWYKGDSLKYLLGCGWGVVGGGGGAWKTNIKEGYCLKRWAWTFCRFKRRLCKKGRQCWWRVDTPMHTMYNHFWI